MKLSASACSPRSHACREHALPGCDCKHRSLAVPDNSVTGEDTLSRARARAPGSQPTRCGWPVGRPHRRRPETAPVAPRARPRAARRRRSCLRRPRPRRRGTRQRRHSTARRCHAPSQGRAGRRRRRAGGLLTQRQGRGWRPQSLPRRTLWQSAGVRAPAARRAVVRRGRGQAVAAPPLAAARQRRRAAARAPRVAVAAPTAAAAAAAAAAASPGQGWRRRNRSSLCTRSSCHNLGAGTCSSLGRRGAANTCPSISRDMLSASARRSQ